LFGKIVGERSWQKDASGKKIKVNIPMNLFMIPK
jgi:hypothetical protein